MPTWILFARDYSEQLNRIEGKLNKMSEMEARLDEVINSVRTTVQSVVDLVGQVLDKLNQAGSEVDLSDETDTLTSLQTDLQGAVDRMQSAVGSTTPTQPSTGETTPPDTGESSSSPDETSGEPV